MRTQEVIKKIKKAHSLDLTVIIRKNAVVFEGNKIPFNLETRPELFQYLSGLKNAYVKIENSQRVVNSMLKKIKGFGFSISLVEKTVMPYGAVHHYVTISK